MIRYQANLLKIGLIVPVLILLAGGLNALNAQAIEEDQPLFNFSGYVKDLGMARTDQNLENPMYGNLLHNRLELGIYPTDQLSFTLEGRNRWRYGDQVKQFSDRGRSFGDLMSAQDGLLDLSTTWHEDDYSVVHSEVDRLYATYETGDWRFRLGRQRINWGKNRIWNPNDLFNTYSFLDFDYEKRPGVDAFRAEYYRDYSSSIELAFNPAEDMEQSIGALYYSFHEWEYDFQLLSGYFEESIVTGFGWSGYIGGASFKGEANYYTPTFQEDKDEGYALASVSTSYTFPNSIGLHVEGIYNGNENKAGIYQLLNSSGLQANNLSMFEFGVFGQLDYQLHPLVNTSIGSIHYPEQGITMLTPSITYSFGDNWEVYALAQWFAGKTDNLSPNESGVARNTTNQFNLFALRLQWSF